MNRDNLLRGLSKVAWAYVLLFFDLNLGTLNLLPEWAGYLLLGQVLESRCTAYVNPLYTVICKVKKEYLRPRQWGGKGAKGGTGQ